MKFQEENLPWALMHMLFCPGFLSPPIVQSNLDMDGLTGCKLKPGAYHMVPLLVWSNPIKLRSRSLNKRRDFWVP